jgi:hypothetical protein
MRTGTQTAKSDAENLAASRALAQNMLDGTHLVPTHTCRKCGERALVKDGVLQSDMRGCSGTAVVPEITICLNTDSDKPCGHVAVRRCVGLSDLGWLYGNSKVELVNGPSYLKRNLPQLVTDEQRVRTQEFLIQTANP